eukprot:TRINITY_DN5194_c0_g1_i4.p1 TRINITY_DN5194_c0_g1~~TRINITY_DN5194_c0_g1_i4.p1  ORF type:complete len:340 (-),score=51.68 TRINITY_DN5194_c0_g1_i4:80-1036(-)
MDLNDYSLVNKLLFPARASSYRVADLQGYLCWIPCPGYEEVVAMLIPYPRAKYTMIYLHGNGEDIGTSLMMCDRLQRELGVSMVLLEYPGYGVAAGKPHENSVIRAARTLVNWLITQIGIPQELMIIFGRSIGSGPGTILAKEFPDVAGLILMSAYTSISDLVKYLVGSVAYYLVSNRFPTNKNILEVRCPILFIHGDRDTLIPPSHSTALYESCQHLGRRMLAIRPGMTHNDFDFNIDILGPIREFFHLYGEPHPWEVPAEFCVPPEAPPSSSDGILSNLFASSAAAFQSSVASMKALSSSLSNRSNDGDEKKDPPE